MPPLLNIAGSALIGKNVQDALYTAYVEQFMRGISANDDRGLEMAARHLAPYQKWMSSSDRQNILNRLHERINTTTPYGAGTGRFSAIRPNPEFERLVGLARAWGSQHQGFLGFSAAPGTAQANAVADQADELSDELRKQHNRAGGANDPADDQYQELQDVLGQVREDVRPGNYQQYADFLGSDDLKKSLESYAGQIVGAGSGIGPDVDVTNIVGGAVGGALGQATAASAGGGGDASKTSGITSYNTDEIENVAATSKPSSNTAAPEKKKESGSEAAQKPVEAAAQAQRDAQLQARAELPKTVIVISQEDVERANEQRAKPGILGEIIRETTRAL